MYEKESVSVQSETGPADENKTWYTPLTRVTKLSRVLAAVLFVGLPFLGFWLGVEYGGSQYIDDVYPPEYRHMCESSGGTYQPCGKCPRGAQCGPCGPSCLCDEGFVLGDDRECVIDTEKEELYISIQPQCAQEDDCCWASVKYAEENGFRLIPYGADYSCPSDFNQSSLRCPTSHSWCESVSTSTSLGVDMIPGLGERSEMYDEFSTSVDELENSQFFALGKISDVTHDNDKYAVVVEEIKNVIEPHMTDELTGERKVYVVSENAQITVGYGLLSNMSAVGLINPPYQYGTEVPVRTMSFADFAYSFENETEKWNAAVNGSTPARSLEFVVWSFEYTQGEVTSIEHVYRP